MYKIFILLVFFFPFFVKGQEYVPHKSIHQIENEKYNKLNFSSEQEWATYNDTKNSNFDQEKNCKLDKIVFGWHPYWAGTDYYNYQWSYLSDLAYFAYEVNYLNGEATSLHGWETAAVVDTALKHGVRVHLTATLFGNHDNFFANSSAQNTLINNLVNQAVSRNAKGINIDFEGMGSDNRDDFSNFIENLSVAFKTQVPDGIISICLYAVDWGAVFDFSAIDNFVDLYTIMGYDYYYAGSSEAGPTGQLYLLNNFNYTQSRTISYYLNAGASREKLILGVPYFGFEWQTSSNSVPSNTTSTGTAKTLEEIKNNSNGYYSNPQIDPNCLGNYYTFYKAGNWYQTWIEDETTLKYSYKLVNQIGIGGIAIWALSYDNGYTEMWDLIHDYFSEFAEVPLSDSMWDLGGPTRNHYNFENFTYTIKPTRGKDLTLTFTDFELEENYDSLYIYDGENISAPLIGGYSGTTNPGVIIASGNALTLRFFSDVATVKQGWTAIWNSNADDENPSTIINSPDWNHTDFIADFEDTDNSAIKQKFYQVLDFDGTEWRANADFGYINDNFDQTSINSEWNNISGSWSTNNGHLLQSNDELGNTNLFIDCQQDSGYIYLYNWSMDLSGTEGNRRAGIHFFCDDASQNNRHNNYMVYFRADQNTVQIYKYINNNYTLEMENSFTIDPDTWYDYKIIYNSNNGEIKAYINNVFVSQWVDPEQITMGNSVSLRVGNAIAQFDDFKMYRSRDESELISVGSTNDEIRFENENLSSPAGKINSIVIDYNDNFSSVGSKDINTDFTVPDNISLVNDGISDDLDTTFSISQLTANWTEANEDNSGIANYWYAVGTTPLNDDIYSWTKGNSQTNKTITGLALQYENIYYFSVKPENLAGLVGNATSSDGIRVVLANEPPTAELSVSENEICAGDTLYFYYNGMNGVDFTWIFEGSTTDTSHLMNPTVIYNESGIFDVTLIASNSIGADTLFEESFITVHQTPYVDFVANSTYGDLPFLASFENLSDENANSYFWDFGDGNTYNSSVFESVIQHIYSTSGNFSVSLSVENDYCSNETFKENYISVGVTNIEENNFQINIYPNPAQNILFVENELNTELFYEIIDINGKLLLTGKVESQIDISTLKSGTYIILLNTESQYYLKNFIKE